MGVTVAERDFYNDIRQINKKTKDHNKIDWEQRRYEIAKEIFTRCLSSSDGEMRAFCAGHLEMHARDCVREADVLIEELQKAKKE